MEFLSSPNGSLFKLTKEEYNFIMDLIREENPVPSKEINESYTKSDFLKEVYMDEKNMEILISLLENKKNIIIQGAPGVGKTFIANRLAYLIMGEKDNSRIEQVQFHQSYSYENFVIGYRPKEEGFKLEEGIFLQFCRKALNDPEKPYFFIIDEINRGNISKIFGELLMLIENSYRDKSINLSYGDRTFSVPKNVYIIGMMNTADRSLAMIDYALRRRFSFFDMKPGFDSDGFKLYQRNHNSNTLDDLINQIKSLNLEIENDDSLGSGFYIGHSYFCNQELVTNEWLEEVVEFDILPTLREYWFDDLEKLEIWEANLRGVFND